MASFVHSTLLLAAFSIGLAAQIPAQQARRVSGVIERTMEDTTAPLAGAWVVLHRVGRGSAGPIDSMRSDARGRYAFQYRTTADSAVYFASSMYSGVAYFTPPFATADVRDDAASIMVFDTSSAGPGVMTRSHHVVVFSAAGQKVRRVSEVYWLENPNAATRVASRNGPAWAASLPADANGARVDDGNIPVDGVRLGNGIVQVFAPLAPGLHQLHISYDIPVKSFPLGMTVADSTMVFEVLIEDANGTVRGGPFQRQEPVTVEQRSFRRVLAHDVRPGTKFDIIVPKTGGISGRTLYVMVVIAIAGFALLLGLTRSTTRRPPLPSVSRSTPPQAEQLAHAIAALDEHFAKQKHPDEAARDAYNAKRRELNDQLAEILEARDNSL